MDYKESEYLMISGIQHFSFCRRQWALIHIENLWDDNFKTIDGMLFHKNAHDRNKSESRKDILIKRGLRVFSSSLGVTGECDVVEFHQSKNGITLKDEEGKWMVVPIEYKRGKVKENLMDELQLCCEAMCLEDMLCCKIEKGYLFYGELRRRVEVTFDEALRENVKSMLYEMHDLHRKKYTPKVKQRKSCQNCSLKDQCLPKLTKLENPGKYVKEAIDYEKTS